MASPEAPDKTLLIVEDDPGLRKQLKWCFDEYAVVTAEDRETALAAVRRHAPPVVLQDLGLPPDAEGVTEGLETLREILAFAPGTKVIVVTGNGDRENAVRSVAIGAYDFYQKPVDVDVLKLLVSRAFALKQLEEENQRLAANQSASPMNGIIAGSPPMQKVCRMVERVASADVTTLLLGESGTGKEVLARALHDLSSRKDGRFVAINCAAIPENLLESELFGYEKGAFTGAHKQTKGKVELADGGTLLLDEIGDMQAQLQSKLLRFLQERVVERVGGREEIPVDVRVVCATNQDLKALIADGRFREDLFYRVSEITIQIPPLRDRDGDQALLARFLLDRFARELGRKMRGFSEDAQQAIQNYALARQRARDGEPDQRRGGDGGPAGRQRRGSGPWRLLRGAVGNHNAQGRSRAGRARCAHPSPRRRRWQGVQGRRSARRDPADRLRPDEQVRSEG